MTAWQLVPYVGSSFSLAAFIVAALYYSYRARLKQTEILIKTLPAKDRLDAISIAAEQFHVDLGGLTASQQREIVLAQIAIRARRELMMALTSALLAVLAALITIIAILTSRHDGTGTSSGHSESQIAKLSCKLRLLVSEFTAVQPDGTMGVRFGSDELNRVIELGIHVAINSAARQMTVVWESPGRVTRSQSGLYSLNTDGHFVLTEAYTLKGYSGTWSSTWKLDTASGLISVIASDPLFSGVIQRVEAKTQGKTVAVYAALKSTGSGVCVERT